LQLVERPTRARENPRGRALASREPARARIGDHRTIVRAQRRARIVDADPARFPRARERRTQRAIRADAAGDNEPTQARCRERPLALRSQRVDDRGLKRSSEIGACLRVERDAALRLCLNRDSRRGLKATEAEIEAVALERPRKRKGRRVAFLRKRCERRPAGIGQPEQASDLVERLARRIVERLPDDAVPTERSDRNEPYGRPRRVKRETETPAGLPRACSRAGVPPCDARE
jgi:hypothetical protein